MNIVIRAYVGKTCMKDPDEIMKMLSKATGLVELDVADEKGHVRMSDTDEMAGQTLKVGDYEFIVPEKAEQPTP